MQSVIVGDPVHKAAVDFALGQEKIFGKSEMWEKMGYGTLGMYTSYEGLVALSAARISEANPL
jgi:hypothetical protein